MADFDARLMLDRYLYDYFMKKNLPELAETFKNEANLEIDPNVPLAIDVPEGFLLEWWKVNCDFASLREWLNQREKPSMEATQEHNDSQSGKFFMHSEINKQLLIDYASAMSTGRKSPALHERGKALLAFSTSSHEQGLLTPNLAKYIPSNHPNTSGHKPEPIFYATLGIANTGSIEKSDGSTSEAIMTDGDTSGTSDCTSNIGRLSTASEVPTVRQLDSNNEK
ncbi:uncharacterized protein LOC129317856 isoform X2 [Prosopis cineraria]|uniref:uncharacterized protein LOC129317856 isoform X2 n=1 Tax=Prosopis cineraria TaxID=364024 RepID=UPI00240EDB48|nr:uncharacterized protein LOC129317856 isoform X2 [Prosopis cineraria]